MRSYYVGLIATIATGFLAQGALAAAFAPGNLVIYRIGAVGDGQNPNAATDKVFIDEYTTSAGQTVPVQSIAVPFDDPDGAGPQHLLTAQGSALYEGLINRSTDGQYLTFAGYESAIGNTNPAQTLASSTNRIIGRVDYNGNLDTSTVVNDLDGGADATPSQSGSPRSVISTNGVEMYIVGNEGGIRRTTFGNSGPSTQVSTGTLTDFRHVDIFGGQIYASTGVSGPNGVQQLDLGTGTLNGLHPIPGGMTSGDALQFFMADLSVDVPGIDTIYLTDSRAQNDGGGLRKYALNGATGNWDAKGGVFYMGAPPAGEPSVSALRGLTGVVEANGDVSLYGVRNSGSSASVGQGQLLKFVDTTGHSGTMSGAATLLATAQLNTRFTGIDFAPTPLKGDYNGNGVDDGADYVVWRDRNGTPQEYDDW